MRCSECKVEMTVWEKDVFDYTTGQQLRDVPHWHCPKCKKWIPYVEVER